MEAKGQKEEAMEWKDIRDPEDRKFIELVELEWEKGETIEEEKEVN
jgi:hypothetical protein